MDSTLRNYKKGNQTKIANSEQLSQLLASENFKKNFMAAVYGNLNVIAVDIRILTKYCN